MPFQFTHPIWLPAVAIALAAVVWLSLKSDASLSGTRRWLALAVRLLVVLALGLALAGLRYRLPVDALNVFFVLDRSDSIPSGQQEAARQLVNRFSEAKRPIDRGGVVVFGADAAIESAQNEAVQVERVQAVVQSGGTDLAGAIRLATAAFPEVGQRRIVVLSDGQETVGDALEAVVSARSLGVTVDVVPLGAERQADARISKVGVPNRLKKGQTFGVRIFAESDRATRANLSLFRNDQLLGTEPVDLQPGKNLFTFSQTIDEPGFYTYDVRLDAPGDQVPQNNRSVAYAEIRGNPRVALISSDPPADERLAAALRESGLEVRLTGIDGFPATLAAMQSQDAILLGNVAAGDLGPELLRLLESAVRDFGVGLVAIGGDQAFAAGGYRGTPLETALPVDMELNSRKVLPRGALVLVVHATEFPNGNQWARDIASAALLALGPQDEMGIVHWNGSDTWLFELSPVGDRREKGRAIAGMNPGDMPAFENVMSMAHQGLAASTANLKHMVVFSDGDPSAPSTPLLQRIVGDRITISTVMIGGHVEPGTMIDIAETGRGRFYDVRSPGSLPQIFTKEAAVILKAAIIEDPFRPRIAGPSEIIRGLTEEDLPPLRGYVATTPKSRAEVPLVSDKGDPLLAHWQFGLGRAVAFTSDARARWASEWHASPRFRQFWSQLTQWSLRKVDAADLNADLSFDQGQGTLSVEALDAEGNFRNFLNLQAVVVDPRGNRQVVRLDQRGPGRYEAAFPAGEVGAYMINLLDLADGAIRGSQTVGGTVNYSAEFALSGTRHALLNRLAEVGGGRVLNPDVPADNPFLHDRQRTERPRDLWWWLLAAAVVLFPLDVGLRRVQLDPEELRRAWQLLLVRLGWGRRSPVPAGDPGLSTLLARKEQVRSTQTSAGSGTGTSRPPAPEAGPGDTGPLPPRPPTTPPPPRPGAPAVPGPATPTPPAGPEVSSTDRLLEAKRRARRKT